MLSESNNSIPHPKETSNKRYAIDSNGNVHHFTATDQEATRYHWAGRTGSDQPVAKRLNPQNISNEVAKELGTTEKKVNKE